MIDPQPGALRLPAEWEPQAAILLAWPHADTDWAANLAAVEQSYIALVSAITEFQAAIVLVASAEVGARARVALDAAGVPRHRWRSIVLDYDDTWLRDSGPITLVGDDGFVLLDFAFTGWGGKFAAARDDGLIKTLVTRGLFRRAQHRRINWALEGGAIESDGAGSVLSTRRCLAQRHPHSSTDELVDKLRTHLSAERVLLLESGALEGDDTDAHIDTLARFAPADAIVYQSCTAHDDPHFAELAAMADELRALRTRGGRPYTLHALPFAQPITDASGRRLAASYANYLVVNAGVLVPAYSDPADALAANVIGQAHPGRRVVQVPCRPIIEQNGSLHCLTMQLPLGVLADVE